MNIIKQQTMDLSKKHRWLMVVVYVLITYLNLFLLPFIANIIEKKGIASCSTTVIFIVFLLALYGSFYFLFHVRQPRAYQLLAVIVILYLVSLQDMPDPISRIHLVEYSILMWLLFLALKTDFAGLKLYGLAISMLFIIGLVNESLQLFLPQRVFDINDIFDNVLGGYLGAAVYWVLNRYHTVRTQTN